MSAHVDPVRFDEAEGSDRRLLVDHLRACAACRVAAAEHDPTILFSLLDRAPVPAALLDRVSAGVAERVAAARPGSGMRRAAAAAMVAMALICGYATFRHEAPAPRPTLDRPRAAVDVRPADAVSGVVDFTVGDTQVVMVYNGDLRL